MVYWQTNIVKYNVDQEITRNYEKLQIDCCWFFTLLQIFVYIQSKSKIFGLSVFGFNLFKNKWLFEFSQIFGKFSLGFEYQ
jgi:hypothetical protein